MSKDELTEEDAMKYLEECNESQDIHGVCYIPAIVCSKILDLYQKEKEKNKELTLKITDQIIRKVEIEVFEDMRKELEQEKEKNKKLKKENEELDEKFKYAVPDEIVDELYISKDKIREILEYYEHTPADDPDATIAFYSDIKKLLKGNNENNEKQM